jgi:acetyltransferase-like isoleucine patch superfamily enzyme
MNQTPSKLLIIGNGFPFDFAQIIGSEQNYSEIKSVHLDSADFFNFNISFFDSFPKNEWYIIVASDSYAINYARMHLTIKIVSKGYKLATLISSKSTIGPQVIVSPGCLITPSAFIMGNVSIGIGTIIGPECFIRSGCKLDKFVFLNDRVSIGEKSIIQLGSSIGSNIFLENNTVIGKHCEILLESQNIKRKTDRFFLDKNFSNGMQIFNL